MAHSTAKEEKLHIVMYPWFAFGHMLPFLELSKLIAGKGHRVSFVSTPRNIDRLPKPPPELSPFVTLVKLPVPQIEHLPENAEATIDLPYHKVKYLKKAYDALQEPITQFLQESAPDWVMFDFTAFWLGPVASKLGISTAFFSPFMAPALCFFGPVPVLTGTNGDCCTKPEDFTVPPKWIPFESKLAYRLFEINRILDDVVQGDDDIVSATYRLGVVVQGCDVVTVRSAYEFEPEWLQLLQELYSKPVIPIGLLPPGTVADVSSDNENNEEWKTMKQWLDKQNKGAVVYVALGSEARLSQAELSELALGLELSELPFLWALRKRLGLADTAPVELPDGFEERTKGRGLVWTSWAPQLNILSHDSVGGFMNHSGWSSVVEGLGLGKPLILLTTLADTGLNCRILEDKKLGYPIPRDDQDGSFTRNSVAESLRLVVFGDEGKIYRDKAKEMKGLFGNEAVQDRYVDNLLHYLVAHNKKGPNPTGEGHD